MNGAINLYILKNIFISALGSTHIITKKSGGEIIERLQVLKT